MPRLQIAVHLLQQRPVLRIAGAIVLLPLAAVVVEVVQLAVVSVPVHHERPVVLAHAVGRPAVLALVIPPACWNGPEDWLRAPLLRLTLQHRQLVLPIHERSHVGQRKHVDAGRGRQGG